MKIESIECGKFAGIADRKVEFSEGLNLLVGKNESGKSTLAELAYHLLFQAVKLKGNNSKNKAFKTAFFPTEMGSYQTDTIDGAICFSTEDGTYTLSKEWNGKNGSAKLYTPEGARLTDGEQIQEIIKEKLIYGKGIYDELIFCSQNRWEEALRRLLSGTAREGAKMELVSSVGQAVMEAGGISIDRLEAEIAKKVNAFASHWDFDADGPEGGKKRGIDHEWGQKVGAILEKYYDLEKARRKQENAYAIEKEAELAEAKRQQAEQNRNEAKGALERFQSVQNLLVEQSNLKELLEKTKVELKRYQDAYENWPKYQQEKDQADALKQELAAARYRELQGMQARIASLEGKEQAGSEEYAKKLEEYVKAAGMLQKKLEQHRAMLKGMNISAKLTLLNGSQAEITTVNGGQVELSPSGEFQITEAVSLQIPDVMQLRLLPQGVDVERVTNECREWEGILGNIYAFYQVGSYTELAVLKEENERNRRELEDAKKEYGRQTEGQSIEELEEDAKKFQGVLREKAEVLSEIRALCGNQSIDLYIGRRVQSIDDYKREFLSFEQLKEKIEVTKREQEARKEKIDSLEGIPEEYAEKDPKQLEAQLKKQLETCEKDLAVKTDALSKAESRKELLECTTEEYGEQIQELEKGLAECKEIYHHWKHIQKVFTEMQQSMSQNPMGEIQEKFDQYLQLITNGNVRLQLQECSEKMDVTIASGKYKMSMEHLSEGTKDTVLLAYRLAVLEYLYPDGGGMAVFDDPFTDMDPVRKGQACRLLEEFAKGNQVIFLTCDGAYGEMFGECKVIAYDGK